MRRWSTRGMGWLGLALVLGLAPRAWLGVAAAQPVTYVEYPALVDEHDTPLPAPLPAGWYFNAMAGGQGRAQRR